VRAMCFPLSCPQLLPPPLFCPTGPTPVVTSISPSHGVATGGITLTIVGTNFRAGVAVSLGGVPCDAASLVDEGTVICLTPSLLTLGRGAANLSLVNLDETVSFVPEAFMPECLSPPTSGPLYSYASLSPFLFTSFGLDTDFHVFTQCSLTALTVVHPAAPCEPAALPASSRALSGTCSSGAYPGALCSAACLDGFAATGTSAVATCTRTDAATSTWEGLNLTCTRPCDFFPPPPLPPP